MELITITLAEVLMMSSLFIIMCIQELALKHTRIFQMENPFFQVCLYLTRCFMSYFRFYTSITENVQK